jgi:predicted phage terminase large subunit-like protein
MKANKRKSASEALRGVTPRLSRYIPWRPTPRQAAFLLLPGLEAFFGGAAGGAKSVALLMAALQYADVPGYSALLVRQSYQMLAQPGGLMARAQEWLAGTDATWNAADHQWRFPSGATLTFRHMQDAGAERNFQGAEYHFIGIDEVTDFTEEQYRFLFSRLRRTRDSVVPLRMRAASNPYGPGLEWCHRRFILEGPTCGIVFIPSLLEDNPHLDQESYEASLKELAPLAYRQLRHGDWTVRPEGGLFKASWFEGQLIDLRSILTQVRLCRYWDLAASEQVRGTDPDFTAGVLLGRDRDGIFYVLDVVRARMTPLGVQQLIQRTAEEDRQLAFAHDWRPPAIRMEQEPGGAGKAIVDAYGRLILAAFDFKGAVSSGSKEARAAPVSARAEAGHIRLLRAAWNGAFLDELCAFPHVRHDDQVDALSGAYAQLAEVEHRGHARINRIRFVDSPKQLGQRQRFVDPPPPPPPWERGRQDWKRGRHLGGSI